MVLRHCCDTVDWVTGRASQLVCKKFSQTSFFGRSAGHLAYLLYYCKTLPMSYIIYQRIILFWKRALNSDNMIITTLARINRNEVAMILFKYNIPSLNLSPYAIKSRM